MKYLILLVCFAFLIESITAIIGGEDTDITVHPYQASIRISNSLFCGGVIISERHILTAAHCFLNNPYQSNLRPPYPDVTVHTGTTSSTEPGQPHRIARITTHPKASAVYGSAANDVAVVTLADEIQFNEGQRKAELPSRDAVTGTTGFFTGWGQVFLNNPIPAARLQRLQMRVLSYRDCRSHSTAIQMRPNEICAIQSRGRGSCVGDGGGPLVIGNEVVGILSWVPNVEYARGYPEVFTNVYAQKSFIESTMRRY